MTTYIRVSATVFTLVAVLQAVRVLREWPLAIAGYTVPVSASIVAALFAAALAAWGWATSRGTFR